MSITLKINSFSKYRKAFWSSSTFYQKPLVAHFLLLFRKVKKPNKPAHLSTGAPGMPLPADGTMTAFRSSVRVSRHSNSCDSLSTSSSDLSVRVRRKRKQQQEKRHKRLVVKTPLHEFKVLQTTDFYHYLFIF